MILTSIARLFVGVAFTVFLLAITISPAWSIPLGDIDQQNIGTDIYSNGAPAPFLFGQTFTPTFEGVDAFEFLLGGTNAVTVVRIRDGAAGPDGFSGNIIAESLPTIVDFAGNEWFHFDFPGHVPLMPGHQYLAELYVSDGSLGTRSLIGNQYPGGQNYQQGFPPHLLVEADLIFREGLHVPEPASAILLLIVAGFSWRFVR